MKIQSLKRRLWLRSIGYLISTATFVGAAYYLSSMNNDYATKAQNLERSIARLEQQLEQLNQKSFEFSEAINTWENFSEDQKRLNGLRINDAKSTLDNLAVKNYITDLSTSFSKPEEMDAPYRTDNVVAVESNITLNFKALSDEHVFIFLSQLMAEFPGYIDIKSLSLSRKEDVSKESIIKIIDGETTFLVQGSLDFVWRDLKYIGPDTIEPPAGGDS